MKTVTNKTRSKTTLVDIRTWIVMADQKLEMAYDAAEKGEPVDVLLDHICHSVILEPVRIIHREDLTRADAQRVYDSLFPVLACIQGAIKLAEGTILQPALEGAFELLDAAQTALDPVSDAARSLAPGGAECDFLRGRDIAIKMINEGGALFGERDCYRRHRDPGATQNNFVSGYISDIIDEPALRLGFSAVLSQIVGSGEGFDGKYFAQLTLAETKAGSYGADGTQPTDEDVPEESAPKPSNTPNKVRAAEHEWNPYYLMLQAKDVAEAAALNDEGTDAMWGVHSLIEKALEKVSKAVKQERSDREDLLNKASDELAGTLAVLHAVNNDRLDNSLLHAADTQIRLAKQQLDAEIDQLVRAYSERAESV